MFEFFRRLVAGDRLTSSLISGEFDGSEVGKTLTAWFNEKPAREEQRSMFVQVVCGMGAKPGPTATRLMDCITKAWGGERFGALLAQQLDEVITFDPPRNPDQAEQQTNAKALINGLKQKLRSLDS